MAACLDRLRAWEVDHWHADGALPAPGVYGVPQQWPHVRALYERAGFVHDGHTEIVLLARVDELPEPSEPPVPGLQLGRALGVNGTRLYGFVGDKVVGYIEVDTNLAEGGRLAHLRGWADIGNLHVDEAYRRRGVATWLAGQAADWLRLARVERLLAYAWPQEEARLGLLRRLRFRELTRTARGWTHPGPPSPTQSGAGCHPPGPPSPIQPGPGRASSAQPGPGRASPAQPGLGRASPAQPDAGSPGGGA
jgi:GNAT superfamily N-acetyltransferase